MNPSFPYSPLILSLIAILALTVFLSWRSTFHAKRITRYGLLALRVIGVLCIGVLLLNPGKWVTPQNSIQPVWAILIDQSASMSEKHNDVSRFETAIEIQQDIKNIAEEEDAKIQTFLFDEKVKEADDLKAVSPNATQSNIYSSGDALFAQLQANGTPSKGVIVLSDGRQTSAPAHSNLKLLSKAYNAPIHTYTIGSEITPTDFSITCPRKTITSFAAQEVQVPLLIKNQQLEDQELEVELIDEAGKPIQKTTVTSNKDSDTIHIITFKAPEESSSYQVRIPINEKEQRSNNNADTFYVRVLATKTHIFIAEGAPYWDSKFLAQHLRLQSHMDVDSIHRLNDQRFFKISSDESEPSESTEAIFPDSLDALAKYDLIIFGKNSEHFLTPPRIKLLQQFVRDQGGAILFSRGKPYSGKLPELAPLEPVTWATGNISNFSLTPSPDGAAAGLFGQALPDTESDIWNSLPPLKDAHQVDTVKPFTRILAHGSLEGNQGKFPLLVIKRYGQGVTGLVNADGLWKWDFYPDARELGNMYSEFWSQLLQWMVSYSEYLPGYQYALTASKSTLEIEQNLILTSTYRGNKKEPKPSIQITSSNGFSQTITPALVNSTAGSQKWKSSFSATSSGEYEAQLITDDNSPAPSLRFTVLSPPAESDNLDPDPALLRELAESTDGSVLDATNYKKILTDLFGDKKQVTTDAGLVWQPHWVKWYIPIILILIFGAEWFIRRRSGLS